jgi:DNA polymerase-1
MAQERKTVYLLDGSSYIHRAYHAIGHLSNSKGLPTNAVLGFTRMLLRILKEKAPEYLVVALDAKGPTFRHRIYGDYKATRPPMPQDLVVQLPFIKSIVRALNVKMFEMEGYEADDIIGTLTRICEAEGFDVVIVTGDKDFRQLLSPKTSLWDTMKDKFTEYETFLKEYGLEPGQVIDVMGLTGDSSDNVPGVPGIGEKTATGLIKQFGSLERVLESLDEIQKNRLKENLETSHENALLSKKLVTIEQFVPIEAGADDLKVGEPKSGELSELFRELEFRGLWDQFAPRTESPFKNYQLCLAEEDLTALKERILQKGMVSIDTETTSPEPLLAELVGISLAFEEHRAYYIPVGHSYEGAPRQVPLPKVLNILRDVLEDERIPKVGQNIKYDALVLRRHGVELRGIHFDTMVASYVINPGLRQHSLEYLAQHYLNHKIISYHEVVGKGKDASDFSEVELERAAEYSCEDADITLRLMGVMEKRIREDMHGVLFYGMEMKLLPVLADMEWNGIKIDSPFFSDMSANFSAQLAQIEKDIYAEAGMEFNINSPQQLAYVLFEKLQLPVQKKTAKKRAYSTDVRVLEKLSSLPHRIPGLILRYRTLSKLKSTYLDALVRMVHPLTSRIHTSFNQTVTATGRLSSSNPNLQNIPVRGNEGKEIRKGFVAEEGCVLLSADYSQVELRLFAHYSKDPVLIGAFEKGEDVHSRTASEILGVDIAAVTPEMRRVAKAINFGIIYGMGPQKLSEEINTDLKTARSYISAYYDKYGGVSRFREEMISFARENGYVTTLYNRRRYLPDINHKNRVIQAEAERMAINTPIQGTAADLIKKVMISIHEKLGRERLRSKMLLQVHDELLFEVPEEEIHTISPLIKKEMEGVCELTVPLKVDIGTGRNWDEAHP